MTKEERFEKIYKENYKFLRNFLFKRWKNVLSKDDVVDDIIQETFIRVYKNLDKCRLSDENISNWIMKISINVAIDIFRSNKKEGKVFAWRKGHTDKNIPEEYKRALYNHWNKLQEINKLSQKQEEDLKKAFQIASQHLNKKSLRVFKLKYCDGFTLRQIAKKEKISEVNARAINSRSVRLIKSLMHP